MDNQSVSTENVDVGFDSDQSSSEVGSGTSTATSATGNLEKGLTPKLSSLSAKTDYAGTLPVVIADGLKLKTLEQESSELLSAFSYALFPLMEKSVPLNWTTLVPFDAHMLVEAHHVFYYQLKVGDDLCTLIPSFQERCVDAVILINTTDNYSISSFSLEGVKKVSIPFVVLTKDDGMRLLSTIEDHSGTILARLDAESDVDAHGPYGKTINSDEVRSSKIKSGKKGSKRKQKVIDLRVEFRKLMFTSDMQPVSVSEDKSKFQFLMSTMSNYEKETPGTADAVPSHSEVNGTLRMLKLHFSVLFKEECLQKIEALQPEELAKPFNSFLERGDFQIMIGETREGTNSVSLFEFLREACCILSEVSSSIMTKAGTSGKEATATPRAQPKGFYYARMMWIIMSLKLQFEPASSERTKEFAQRLWSNFVDIYSPNKFTGPLLEELHKGLKFGELLSLPEVISLNHHYITRIVVHQERLRFFDHLRQFIITLGSFIGCEENFLHLLYEIRAVYTPNITSPDFKLSCVCTEGTLANAISEVIDFLESLIVLWNKCNFNHDQLNAECFKWLQLFLDKIDITRDHSDTLLRLFFLSANNYEVLRRHQGQIKDKVIMKTRLEFQSLRIQQFFLLYKALPIWPNDFLKEYLQQCTVPSGSNINDGTYQEFFDMVLIRFPSAYDHYYLLDVIRKVAKMYHDEGRACHFVLDLIQLRLPNLFLVSDENATGSATEDVRKNFKKFIKDYINEKVLKEIIIGQMITMLEKHISNQRHEFQQLCLEAIYEEIAQDFTIYSGVKSNKGDSLKNILEYSVDYLAGSLSWLEVQSPKQVFCWRVILLCCPVCSLTSIKLFSWLFEHVQEISMIGRIFESYCEHKTPSRGRQLEIDYSFTGEEFSKVPQDAKGYFEWIGRIQSSLRIWKAKFEEKNISYEDLLFFTNNTFSVRHVIKFCTHLFVADEYVEETQTLFLKKFDMLNVFLIRYNCHLPGTRWCSLISLLREFGVLLPRNILHLINKFIIFPDNLSILNTEQLAHQIVPITNGKFQPGFEITLYVKRGFSLRMLFELVDQLERFLEPLMDFLDMLFFFKVNHSKMFHNYLQVEMRQVVSKEEVQLTEDLPLPVTTAAESTDQQGIKSLQISLAKTKQLLLRIISGEATYTDINARGTLKLEMLDLEKEFSILRSFCSTVLGIPEKDLKGLESIYSLIELLQYSKHVQYIDKVCEQYSLEGCLKDPQLREVKSLVEGLELDEIRSKLTPIEAGRKLNQIKKLLLIKSNKASKCLDVFPAVHESADFHKFIKDKHFYGEEGQATFRQQYQLITAQLQHEKYDENVLNHLQAAYNVIILFTDTEQSFKSLMTKVTHLNTTVGLQQLETVNKNITLIQLWFLRAEGDTLENIATDLDKVLDTGYYIFKLSVEGKPSMFLKYNSSTKREIKSSKGVHALLTTDSNESFLEVSFRSRMEILSHSRHTEGLNESHFKPEQWNSEQIGDFVRKLGFMDTRDEGGEKIKHFRHISSVAYRLLELYIQLKDLGNPQYYEGKVSDLPCGIDCTTADERVRETEAVVKDWKTRVQDLRCQYKWLLFFSIPKILRLFELLSPRNLETDCCIKVEKILNEVCFLFRNDQKARNALKISIEREFNKSQRDVDSDKPPMYIVGKFLKALFQEHQLPSHPVILADNVNFRTTIPLTHEPNSILHYCPGYTQCQLMQTVVGMFSVIPEAFQVLHCHVSTSEEELSLFLKRAASHFLHSIVLEVNRLPFKIQEGLMQLHLSQTTNALEVPQVKEMDRQSPERACIHFIETEPSVLRDVPLIQFREDKEPSISFELAKEKCKEQVLIPENFSCIELVVGAAGDGKTYYIRNKIKSSPVKLTIVVNESFTTLKAITKLCTLPVNQKNVSVFFNFTMLPPGNAVDQSEQVRYKNQMEEIGWFLFDLLILGYVEDPSTGLSFRMPGGLKWAFFIEVPSRTRDGSLDNVLQLFIDELPALGLIGTVHYILPEEPYAVDEEVQLVCKYLNAYEVGGTKGIDRLCKEDEEVKFGVENDLSSDRCHQLLKKYMSEHIRSSKITQRLFVKYMRRRCEFLDNCPGFYLNSSRGEIVEDEYGGKRYSDTGKLGSTLMSTMLKEVNDFCDPAIKQNWSSKPHLQLIYDYKDKLTTFGLLSLHPENLPEAEKTSFKRIGIKIPSMADLHSRDMLDGILSRALHIKLENNRLSVIDDSAYVLTLDYTIKMLNIHERHECGLPVIIEGETGVGKTKLIEMLSQLWNMSLLFEWKTQYDRIISFFEEQFREITLEQQTDVYQECFQAITNLNLGEYVPIESLLYLCKLPKQDGKSIGSVVQSYLNKMMDDPMVALLAYRDDSLEQFFASAHQENTVETTAELLHAVLNAEIVPTFYKINVHAAMTPADIEKELKPVFLRAHELGESFQKILSRTATRPTSSLSACVTKEKILCKQPFVTVFFDEINTSSYLGLFKEMIVDRTLDGEPIPDNVFIVAACNPHRGNSMASLGTFESNGQKSEEEMWVRGTYYVRTLHPTLSFLMWDYGSLDNDQEEEYIQAKMIMSTPKTPSEMDSKMSDAMVQCLTKLVAQSQKIMREYAYEQMKLKFSEEYSHISSRSCVSQRDIQRVFTFYKWFIDVYIKVKMVEKLSKHHIHAVLVALGIVYYMRLNNNYRKKYSDFIDKSLREMHERTLTFKKVYIEEIDFFINLIKLPKGIARTQALKENIFATIVCTLTHTPLIIVGAPGSSKTMSFNQTIENLKGAESKEKVFQNTDIFRSLDPQYYQCSRKTTSNEVQTVFSRAINRQRSHTHFNLPIFCVVFMDEAGLPEESHESLKVLHYHLDKQEVSFVAITNHVLDAAKTNRAISLFRPEAWNEDLETLAKGCFSSDSDNSPFELKDDLKMIVSFCKPYSLLMQDTSTSFGHFFGLRDFIHFISFLRRKKDAKLPLNEQLVMQALERNFNGTESFKKICEMFLGKSCHKVECRGVLDILNASLRDHPQHHSSENEVRYKLIIDPSDDDSLIRLLFTFGILKREKTRIFMCSNFPADGQLQQINTIAAIRHSAIEGHTVVMSQTDDIQESFYDLFNLRFRRINMEESVQYYTNISIGAHVRPSRVHPDFQCVVVLKKSEIVNTPLPFLNRFEKYLITHNAILETALSRIPPGIAGLIKAAIDKVNEFIQLILGSDSLYGLYPETLNSLVLCLLPPLNHSYQKMSELNGDESEDIIIFILHGILFSLREYTGLHVPKYPQDEFLLDVEAVFEVAFIDPSFQEILNDMDHSRAADVIVDTMNILHSSSDSSVYFVVNTEVCLIITVIQQWLIRHLCKQIIQLLTPEALIVHRNKIPSSYLKHYIAFQSHFNLQSLIESKHRALQATQTVSRSCRSASKLICFTRSSPIIHQFPTEFPMSSLINKDRQKHAVEVLENLVIKETKKLVLCKLSSIVSQTALQDFITKFLSSETAEVCLFLISMQETSKEIVSHIRVMIEEAENVSTIETTKLFVILLHFPPPQFFKQCYPSIFLKGWNHFYLDTIAHSIVKDAGSDRGVVDIRDWFWQCCFPDLSSLADKNTLLEAAEFILPHSISMLASRIFFGSKDNGTFNCSMNGLQRSEALKELLFRKGKKGSTVGRIICEKFRAYWKPKLMIEQLEKAANNSIKQECTLSITESIQTNFKSLFLDFIVYLISKLNEDNNIDIIFDDDCPITVEELFTDILRLFPTVTLPQVTLFSKNLPQPKQLPFTPKSPFSKLVYEIMEDVVEQSKEDANVGLELLGSDLCSQNYLLSREELFPTLKQAAKKRVSANMEDTSSNQILQSTLRAMSTDTVIWNRYFNDFLFYKLGLNSEGYGESFAQQILHSLLYDVISGDSLNCLVSLHVYFHVFKLNISQVASVLRPLNKLDKLYKRTSSASTVLSSPVTSEYASPSHKLLFTVKETKNLRGSHVQLATYIVDVLFDALVTVTFLHADEKSYMDFLNDNTKSWYKTFRNVMMLPNLKSYIYLALDENNKEISTVEAKLNVMQATFLVLQISYKNDSIILKAHHVFRVFFDRHFTEAKQMKTDSRCPRLQELMDVTLGIVFESGSVGSTLLKGLLAHFFPLERHRYHPEDVHCFLELANNERAQVNVNVFKLYLERILSQSLSETGDNPLHLYNTIPRSEIGTILTKSGPPGPFVPMIYQLPPILNVPVTHKSMQQPLAHLYFLTVLQHLTSGSYALSGNIKIANEIINAQNSQDTSDATKAVLYIELQALIQAIAQQLPTQLMQAQISEVTSVCTQINALMDDKTMGGGTAGGHGMIVALHLYKLFNSSQQFTHFFVKKYESITRGINCLEPIFRQIKEKVSVNLCSSHLSPLFGESVVEDKLAALYSRVASIMRAIHENNNLEENEEMMEALSAIAKDCACVLQSEHLTHDSTVESDIFSMIVLLVTYYEFFTKKVSSPILCNVIGDEKIAPCFKHKCYITMIQYFLFPKRMQQQLERVNASNRDTVTQATHFLDSHVQAHVKDPVYDLFNSEDAELSGLSNSLVYLVAVVIGSPMKRTHLWFHLFEPNALENSYMTGFIFNKMISPDGPFYDEGVELTEHGELRYSDCTKNPRTYNLHSLYLLLWANFGAFVMNLLALPDSDVKMSTVINKQLGIRHYCVSQLQKMWQFLRTNLKLSEEKRTLLIHKYLNNFFKVFNTAECVAQGVFQTPQQLEDYERLWHQQIYQPSWSELQETFDESALSKENDLLRKLQYLEAHYPYFPSEADLTHSILSTGDLTSPFEHGHFKLLIHFAKFWRKFQAGSFLLPDLIEFYSWLHTELSYMVRYERATTISVSRVIELAERFTKKNIASLYKRVKERYNNYIKMIGEQHGSDMYVITKEGHKANIITDDIPIIYLLTQSENEAEGNHSWLYTIINEITQAHNEAIEMLYEILQSQSKAHLRCLLPEQPDTVSLTEITASNCLISNISSSHEVNSFLQIIHSHTVNPSTSVSQVSKFCQLPNFDLIHLEEDIVRSYFAGKPLFKPPSQTVQIVFKFKPELNLATDNMIRIKLDLDGISHKLPDEYKETLSADLHKKLEYTFHSCEHRNLIEVIDALRTVCGHLVKYLMQESLAETSSIMHAQKDMTISSFMIASVYQNLSDPEKVFLEIGIATGSLNSNQLACLIDLPLTEVFACYQQFVLWVDLGIYDFSNLPLVLKLHPSDEDVKFLSETLKEKWSGTVQDLEVEVKKLTNSLKQFEDDIKRSVNSQSLMVSIIEHLKCANLVDENDKLPGLIPKTLVLQHYVQFRIILRRLLITIREEIAEQSLKSTDSHDVQWPEFVSDLWTTRLSHFREETYGGSDFIYDPTTGRYGFQGSSDYGSDKETFLNELENDNGDGNQKQHSNHQDQLSEIGEQERGSQTAQNPTENLAHLRTRISQDPQFKEQIKELVSTSEAEQERELHKKAEKIDVGEFLTSINLSKYREMFEREGVSGDVLLEGDKEYFHELGVESAVDYVRIGALLRRALTGEESKNPMAALHLFLEQKGFMKYAEKFEQHQIDGEMLLHLDKGLFMDVLKEVGVTRKDAMTIYTKFTYQ